MLENNQTFFNLTFLVNASNNGNKQRPNKKKCVRPMKPMETLQYWLRLAQPPKFCKQKRPHTYE